MMDPLERAIQQMEGIADSPYGGAGLGIGQAYPVEQYGTPHPDSVATRRELNDAGWDRPEEDAPSLRDQHGNLIPPDKLLYMVLRVDGNIVATWDEGRWWTQQEGAAWEATMLNPAVRLMAEATHAIETENRAQRRRRKR